MSLNLHNINENGDELYILIADLHYFCPQFLHNMLEEYLICRHVYHMEGPALRLFQPVCG